MYDQLDIVLMPFPFNDLSSNKVRPAIIFSNSTLENDKICLMITSKEPKFGIELTQDLVNRELPLRSWIKVSRIFTINENKIIKRLSSGNIELFHRISTEMYKISKYKVK